MTRALILTGRGRYADPWHPFDDTSKRLAGLLCESGVDCEISGDVDSRMAGLGADAPDLLVINVGDPALTHPDDPEPEAEELGRRGLLDYLATGRPLFGVHAASTSFRGIPEWRSILGGVWVRGQSFHPDYGTFAVQVNRSVGSRTAGLDDFVVQDELYSDLSLASDNLVLASHDSGTRRIPLVWSRSFGAARVVFDALGHDTAAYDSIGHRRLIRRSVDWALSHQRTTRSRPLSHHERAE